MATEAATSNVCFEITSFQPRLNHGYCLSPVIADKLIFELDSAAFMDIRSDSVQGTFTM